MSSSNPTPSKITSLQLSSDVYDQLKRLTTVILPGAGALYFALAQIWGLPAAEQVVGTIAALNVFLGVLINASSKNHNSDVNSVGGSLNILPNDAGGKTYSLSVDADPAELDSKSEVRFKINNLS